jgi:hypothetical protein
MWSQRSSFDCLRNQGSVPLSAWSTATVRSTAPGLRGSHFGAGLQTRTRGHTAPETGTRKTSATAPAKIPEDHRCPLPPSERLYCDYIQRVGLPGSESRPRGQSQGGEVLEIKAFDRSQTETRHNLPSPFTIHQGFHPNPALLGNDQTWRRTPDQDEGIA